MRAPAHILRALAPLTLLLSLALAGTAAGGAEPIVTEFTADITPASGPDAIAVGPDKAMWFTEYDGDKIGRVAPGGSIAEYPPSGETQLSAGAHPSGIVTGPEGDIWFCEFATGEIGELDPADGHLLGEYAIPSGTESGPDGIADGPDKAIWFTDQGNGTLGRIDPETHTVTEYLVHQHASSSYEPSALVAGPEGDLWFTLTGLGEVGRLVPSEAAEGTDHGVTLYPLPSGSGSGPEGITLGEEGDLYVAEYSSGRVARVEPGSVEAGTSDGISEYDAQGFPLLATTASDGAIWLTEPQASGLLRFDPAKPQEPSFIGTADGVTGDPTGVAEDGAGHIWFTQFQTPAIGRIPLSSAGAGEEPEPGGPKPAPTPHLALTTVGGTPAFDAGQSAGNGSPIASYSVVLHDSLPPATLECAGSSPVVEPAFAQKVSGTAVLTVTDADGESSSVSTPFSLEPVPPLLSGSSKIKTGRAAALSSASPAGLIDYRCLPTNGPINPKPPPTGVPSAECELVAGLLHVQGCSLHRLPGLCAMNPDNAALIATHLTAIGKNEDYNLCIDHLERLAAARKADAHTASLRGSIEAAERRLQGLSDTFWEAALPVRVNGLTIAPGELGRTTAIAIGGLISSAFTKQYGVYLESAKAKFLLGGYPMPIRERVDFDVSGLDGETSSLANINLKTPVAFSQFIKSASGQALGGIPGLLLEGAFQATLVKGGATQIGINLQLNKLLGAGVLAEALPFTGATTLTTTNASGLQVDTFDIQDPLADLGAIELRQLDLHYDRTHESLSGTVGLGFGAGTIETSLAFAHGEFKEGRAEYDAGSGEGLPVAPPVYLTQLGAGVTFYTPNNPGSTNSLDGDATMSLGPALGSCGLLDVTGHVHLDLYPAPLTIASNAVASIFCIPLLEASFSASSEGYAELGAKAELAIPGMGSLGSTVDGQAYVPLGAAGNDFHLELDGSGHATLNGIGTVGVKAVLSDRGFAACAELSTPVGTWRPGIGELFAPLPLTPQQFLEHMSISFTGCELSPYESLPAGAPAGASAHFAHSAAAGTFRIPAGEQTAVVRLTGRGGAPAVTLTGPGGRTIDTAAIQVTDTQLVLRQDPTSTTLVEIRGAKTGTWSIAPDPGSAPVTALALAHELPRPRIRVRVLRGHGARRIMRYTVAPQPGMTVSFVEAGKGAGQTIGTARHLGGRIAFLPAPAAGPRSIIAVVTENGAPRADLTVARYSTPAPRPGRPSAVRTRRTRGGLLVSFHPAPLSSSTLVAVRLSEGRAVALQATGRSVFVANVPSAVKPVRILLTALRGATRGPTVSAR